jgi:uncharacterized membrane protein
MTEKAMKWFVFSIAVVVMSFVVGLAFYNVMPEQMIGHWNAEGAVDGYTSRFVGLFLVPIMSAVFLALFYLILKIDPLRKNIEKFRKEYEVFVFLLVLFMFYVNAMVITANLGLVFDFIAFLAPAMGVLFFYAGVLLERSKRNWFVGIRTPWTMSSDEVWHDTHKIGGKLFKLSGILSVLGIFFGKFAFWFIIVPVILSAVYLVIYSYVCYKKIKRNI